LDHEPREDVLGPSGPSRASTRIGFLLCLLTCGLDFR